MNTRYDRIFSGGGTGSAAGRGIGSAARELILLAVGLLVLMTLLAYVPAITAGYVWDDDFYVTENLTLRSLDGLSSIWFEVGAVPQYYPLVHTTYWIEYHLWGLNPLGYHLTNILLHSLGAILLWLILRRLGIPGAWVAAAVFALHPVHVESVAWITERKNVLSGVFYLASLLAYLRYTGLGMAAAAGKTASPGAGASPRRIVYALSLILFICALLSKTVTLSLPAAILLLVWWRRGRILKQDVYPLIPFFLLGAAGGLFTAWMEVHHVGAEGSEWSISPVGRFLLAGRILWFYVAKLVWPVNLTFIYPRWAVDAGVWWQWFFPIAALAVIGTLWRVRRSVGRGPLAAVLFFSGTLFPALGFFNVYPMRYSYVADHFQYLAGIGLITLIVATAARFVLKSGPAFIRPAGAVAGLILILLGALTWSQSHAYKNLETLWRHTIARNPDAWMARNNLGNLLARSDRHAEAILHYTEALKNRPEDPAIFTNLGMVLFKLGRLDEAIEKYRQALTLDAGSADTLYNLGNALAGQGMPVEAIQAYEEALRINPDDFHAHQNLAGLLFDRGQTSKAVEHYAAASALRPEDAELRNNLGLALAANGRPREAETQYREALRLDPGLKDAHNNLGVLLWERGDAAAAEAEYRHALQLDPEFADARINRGNLLARQGLLEDATAEYRQALLSDPNHADGHNNLGFVLVVQGLIFEALDQYREAIRLKPGFAGAHNNLGNALASLNRLDEAVAHFSRALEIDPASADVHFNLGSALARLGRYDQAAEHLREVLRVNPGDTEARNLLRRVEESQ